MKLIFQAEENVLSDDRPYRVYVSFDREGLQYLRSILVDGAYRRKHDAVKLLSEKAGAGDMSSDPYWEGIPTVDLVEFIYIGEES